MMKKFNLLNFLFAFACGTMVANLYYAQPILADIANSLGIGIDNIAMITTITQVGYALGLFFVVPLSDILENKKLILCVMAINIIVLFLMGFSQSFLGLLIMSLLVGISSSAVQIIVPFGSSMAPQKVRGAAIGTIMSGLLFGIMLARPLSSFLSGLMDWHSVFFLSGGLTLILMLVFLFVVPTKETFGKMHYFALIASMWDLFKTTPPLRQRGFYHFMVYGSFCLFWIVAPLVLIEKFGFNNNQIALFALIGVVGALVAPMAGRIADRGKTQWATNVALLSVSISMILAMLPIQNALLAFVWLCICGIILDFGISLNLVVGQRILYALGDTIRARLNAVYMAMFFVGGSLGSFLGGYVYAHLGYQAAFFLGGVMGVISFIAFRMNLRKNH